jgi:hypothetical protein
MGRVKSEMVFELTRRQKWNHYIVLLFAAVGIVAGINMRDAILYATTTYRDAEAGIEAQYPKDWLIDFDGDYIFRVRDVSRIGYKTTIQVSTQAVVANTTSRNIFDNINLQRYSILAAYKVLSVEEDFPVLNEARGAMMHYAYAEFGNTNPALLDLPVIVRGVDILAVQRGQAIVITFLADSMVFEEEYSVLESFLVNLKF